MPTNKRLRLQLEKCEKLPLKWVEKCENCYLCDISCSIYKMNWFMRENLDENTIKKWLEMNRKAAEFLEHATDEDFKAMFSNVPKMNYDALKQ